MISKKNGPIIDENETLYGVFSEHWIVLIKPAGFLILSWLLFVLIYSAIFPLTENAGMLEVILWVFAFGAVLVVHHFFFVYVFQYVLSNLILTNKRLIDYRVIPFVQDDVSFIGAEEIKEVEKVRHGILQNFLNYGSVRIKVGGGPIEFHLLAHPAALVNAIEKMRDEQVHASQSVHTG